MDGNKSLEDCEFGMRMARIGCRFILDKEGFVYILDHTSYTDQTKNPIQNFIAVENFGMLRCGVELHENIANRPAREALTPLHLEIIQRETLKYRKFDPIGTPEFEVWKQTPSFDLRSHWEQRRKGSA